MTSRVEVAGFFGCGMRGAFANFATWGNTGARASVPPDFRPIRATAANPCHFRSGARFAREKRRLPGMQYREAAMREGDGLV